MNAVGKIGKLIVEYQYEIEIALLALLALIVLVWIIRLIARAVKRRDVLTEISSRVEDINATVNDINRRQEALISEMPAESEQLETLKQPETPEQPESSGQPEVPEQHGFSGQFETTEQLESSGQPEVPEQHGFSGQFETTEQPESSGQPEVPEQHGFSEQPETSEQHEFPGQFETPEQHESFEHFGTRGWYELSEHPEILRHPEIFGRPGWHEMSEPLEAEESSDAVGFVHDDMDDAPTKTSGSFYADAKPRDIYETEVSASDAILEPGAEQSYASAYSSVSKYYSRDCATDKFGNVYSEEVLNEQIH